MTLLRETFRLWWQKPRPIEEIEDERSVSFLELFYDLSYVVIVAELIHALAKDVTLSGIAGFFFLFAITWWAWVNGSFYHEMHGNNDIRTRVFTFAQMFALAGMAVFIPTALTDGHTGFALSYALFSGIMTYLWWRTGYHDHNHRPMSYPYTLGFAFITGTFLISTFIPLPGTYYMWVVVVAFSILMPLILSQTQRNVDDLHKENSQKIRASLLWCVVMLIQTIEIREDDREVEEKGMVSASISGACILLVGFIPLTAVWLLVIVSAFLMFPVFSAFYLWVKRTHRRQQEDQ